MADFTKQLIDVSRNLSSFVDETKKTNKNLEEINKTLTSLVNEGFGKTTEKLNTISESLDEQTDKLSQGLEFDQAEFQKFIKENLTESQTKSIEKIVSAVTKGGGENKLPIADLSKLSGVLGSFRKGGKATKTGDYLVGENGPEIVTLEEGSTVIPLNIKDLLDNFKSVQRSYFLPWVKDDSINLEKSGQGYFLKSDTGKFNLERMIKSTEEDITLNETEGIKTGSEKEYLSFLKAVAKKIDESPEVKAEKIVSPEKLSEKQKSTKEEPTTKKEEIEKEEKARKSLFDFKREKESPEGTAEKVSNTEKLIGTETPEERKKLISEANKEKLREKTANVLSGTSNLISSGSEFLQTPEQKKLAQGFSGILSKQAEKLSSKQETASESSGKTTPNISLQSSKLELSKKAPKKEAEVKPGVQQKETIIREKSSETKFEKSGGLESSSMTNKEGQVSSKEAKPEITKSDIDDLKSLLFQMVSILKGPLNTYSPSPYRPDSKRI